MRLIHEALMFIAVSMILVGFIMNILNLIKHPNIVSVLNFLLLIAFFIFCEIFLKTFSVIKCWIKTWF